MTSSAFGSTRPSQDARVRRLALLWSALLLAAASGVTRAEYINFEVSHVHPIDLTPDGTTLLAVNTPDALLERFAIDASGGLIAQAPIPVGLEPVTVVARTSTEAWVVNHVSDSVSIVDLVSGVPIRTLVVGDEPTDVAFAQGKAFVAVSREDSVKVYDLANLDAAPTVVKLFGSRIRALAVSNDGATVYAIPQDSGNQTAVIAANVIFGNDPDLNASRLTALGLNTMACSSAPLSYPPMPSGIARNPALTDPPSGIPQVSLIVKWDGTAWRDDANRSWNQCVPYRMPDHDLFAISAASPANPPVTVDHLGTTLFEVSVQPGTGRVFVAGTDARNFVRFEPRLRGHIVDNELAIVDPSAGNSVNLVDLNAHINRASDPATNLAERVASISQPGMMVWKADGSAAYLTAIGSRKLFAVAGACAGPSCIFGANRAAPSAVEVGDGPTGVALLEAKNRLYVLNRISASIALVDAPTLTKIGEVPLHDPGPPAIRDGRRFLYDAILSSGHGDAACSSCHLSGDKDGLAWDLGDPPASFVPYNTANDNVRFVAPIAGNPVACNPASCASHSGFDPQKGPMATQTLRGMLEPLHWRGDRPTVNDFNPAFVALLDAHDVGPVAGKPAGLSAAEMDQLRQFSLGLRFPPNPYRNPNDSLSTSVVVLDRPLPLGPLTGDASRGSSLFNSLAADVGQPCVACHGLPFGAAGGKLGGVTPEEPTRAPDAAALLDGDAVHSLHSDMKVAHLRNLYDKPGFLFGPAGGPYPEVKGGNGFAHDGSIPNLPTFLSTNNFNLSATDVRDISAFVFSFATGTRAAVGENLTCPPGAPPQAGCDEALLTTLTTVGNQTSAGRHCELTASAVAGGRVRSYRYSGGAWQTDVAGEPSLTTAALRTAAESPITFLCATIGSGTRLGGDRDEDGILNGDDCAPADARVFRVPIDVAGLTVTSASATQVAWADQSAYASLDVRYEVAGGLLSALSSGGLASATSCLASDVATLTYSDTRPDPPLGDAYYYLVRARDACGAGPFGPSRAVLDPLSCVP